MAQRFHNIIAAIPGHTMQYEFAIFKCGAEGVRSF